VTSGSRTLKDAVNEAMRDWVTNVRNTHYIVGSAIGSHPFPTIVRDFQSVIGREARAAMLERVGRLPDAVVACVGGGSNCIGMFNAFLEDASVKLIGVEAGGDGVHTARHSATLAQGTPGVLHGTRSYVMQNADGQITETHSVSAGLDYPGVGPQHAFLKDSGRATYVSATDKEALEGVKMLSRTEGIIPALEPAHAIAHAAKLARSMRSDQIVLVNSELASLRAGVARARARARKRARGRKHARRSAHPKRKLRPSPVLALRSVRPRRQGHDQRCQGTQLHAVREKRAAVCARLLRTDRTR